MKGDVDACILSVKCMLDSQCAGFCHLKGTAVVDKGLRHSILPRRGGMTGQSAPTVRVCWSL